MAENPRFLRVRLRVFGKRGQHVRERIGGGAELRLREHAAEIEQVHM